MSRNWIKFVMCAVLISVPRITLAADMTPAIDEQTENSKIQTNQNVAGEQLNAINNIISSNIILEPLELIFV